MLGYTESLLIHETSTVARKPGKDRQSWLLYKGIALALSPFLTFPPFAHAQRRTSCFQEWVSALRRSSLLLMHHFRTALQWKLGLSPAVDEIFSTISNIHDWSLVESHFSQRSPSQVTFSDVLLSANRTTPSSIQVNRDTIKWGNTWTIEQERWNLTEAYWFNLVDWIVTSCCCKFAASFESMQNASSRYAWGKLQTSRVLQRAAQLVLPHTPSSPPLIPIFLTSSLCLLPYSSLHTS